MKVFVEKDYSGFWGKPTATIDWCEANYEITYYIAEFWNTISNVSMVIPPLIGMLFAVYCKYELRVFLSHLFLLVVGAGSSLFHGSLLYSMQLMDELPMIWGSSFLIYCLVEVDGPENKRNDKLIWILLFYCSVVTGVYLTIKNPVFHEVAYALMVFTMIYYAFRAARLYRVNLWLLMSSLVVYGTGFLVWNLDNIFCTKIREIRSSLDFPLRPLLQGHAWWHLMAGFGTYLNILYATHARNCYLKKYPRVQLVGSCLPIITILPKDHRE